VAVNGNQLVLLLSRAKRIARLHVVGQVVPSSLFDLKLLSTRMYGYIAMLGVYKFRMDKFFFHSQSVLGLNSADNIDG
jgi:hypothetical protein